MTAKNIERLLEQTLLHDGAMQYGLYEYELEELVDELTSSLVADQDDYIFAVTENSEHVAMVLIEKSGQVHINEQAREKLRALWPATYESRQYDGRADEASGRHGRQDGDRRDGAAHGAQRPFG